MVEEQNGLQSGQFLENSAKAKEFILQKSQRKEDTGGRLN